MCFDEYLLFHVITGKHYPLHKFIVNQSLFATAIFLRSLKTVFSKRSVFYLCYPHNNRAMLLITKVLNKASTSNISLIIFLLITFFCILSFCKSKDGESVPQFYLLMQFKPLSRHDLRI